LVETELARRELPEKLVVVTGGEPRDSPTRLGDAVAELRRATVTPRG
jgi:hypothetical protein